MQTANLPLALLAGWCDTTFPDPYNSALSMYIYIYTEWVTNRWKSRAPSNPIESKFRSTVLVMLQRSIRIYIYMCVTIKTLAQEFYGHLWYVLPGRHRKSRGRAQNILISLFFSISVNICCCSDSKLVGRTIYIYDIYIYIYIWVTIKTPAQEFYGHWWYVLPGRHRKARGRAQNILVSLFFTFAAVATQSW